MNYQVIIPAAGQGKRMGAGKNKLFLELRHIPVLIHTLTVFEADPSCTGVFLAIHPQDRPLFHSLIKHYSITKVVKMVTGGEERQHSVFNALKEVENGEIVLVHDGARPFIELPFIQRLVVSASETGASLLAVKVKDTIKKASNQVIVETIERSSLWSVQTPQAFRFSILMEAHRKAQFDQFLGTDDASLVERLDYPVSIVEGNYDNIKLTTPEDLYFAEAILQKREDRSEEAN